jgi:two-component system nitrate/nitrite response regulator NarL
MNKLRILIIDDHTLFRVGLEGLLTSRGIEVVAAVGSGHEAQRLVDELNPDIILLDMRMPGIILLDMRMPGINGLEVLEMLRKTNDTLPIVMLTTSTDENDLLKSLRSGAQGYLLTNLF